jgi:hypothetical protein
MKMLPVRLSLTLALCLLLGTACSRPANVGLEGNNPPTFTFSGNDKLRVFEIYEVKSRDGGGECLCLVWSVADWSENKSLGELGSIKYGEVPQGWKQLYPSNGAASPLVPDQTYQYWLNIGGKVEVMRDFGIYEGKLTHTLKE